MLHRKSRKSLSSQDVHGGAHLQCVLHQSPIKVLAPKMGVAADAKHLQSFKAIFGEKC